MVRNPVLGTARGCRQQRAVPLIKPKARLLFGEVAIVSLRCSTLSSSNQRPLNLKRILPSLPLKKIYGAKCARSSSADPLKSREHGNAKLEEAALYRTQSVIVKSVASFPYIVWAV
jgi:hypothetical protein